MFHIYMRPSVDSLWIYLETAVCARMLTMKHWFRVSFILSVIRRAVHFAYIVSSLVFIFIWFEKFAFFSTKQTIHLLFFLLSSRWPSFCVFFLYIHTRIFFSLRFSGSTSHENQIEERYSIQFEKHRPMWCVVRLADFWAYLSTITSK